MKKNRILVSWMAALSFVAATAQSLSPLPQRVVWGDKAFDQPKNIAIKGADEADVDAVALLRSNFGEGKKGIKVVIGERGDKAVKAYEAQIPNKVEGYYLSVGKNQVVIAGNDEAGTYYGVQTFLQMAAQAEVMKAEVQDWPDVLERGVVEGFYGNPWSHTDRLRQFDFYGKNKLNVYIYGPKDDPYHRNQWREAYPEAEAARISELAKAAAQNKVDFFIFHLSVGLNIQKAIEKIQPEYAVFSHAWELGHKVDKFRWTIDDLLQTSGKISNFPAERCLLPCWGEKILYTKTIQE